jgi:hypothetical protein
MRHAGYSPGENPLSLLLTKGHLHGVDPQLICYSWMRGISDVAVVAFIRKRFSEIQYLKATITDKQRQEYGQLVEATVSQIEAGQFPPHNGICFPQNGCISCAQLGLCLGDQQVMAWTRAGKHP